MCVCVVVKCLGGFINENFFGLVKFCSKGVGWEFNDSALCLFIHTYHHFTS